MGDSFLKAARSRTMDSAGTFTLFYHGAAKKFLGRAHGPLTILNQAGARFEVKGKEDAPTDTTGFVVPMLTTPSGVTIGQQGAILYTLGKAFDLYPRTADGEAIALNIVENMMDLTGDLGKGPDRVTKWLGTWEAALKASDSGYLVGDALTYADCASYLIVKVAADKVPPPPLVKSWLQMMAETDGVKAVAAMKLPLMP